MNNLSIFFAETAATLFEGILFISFFDNTLVRKYKNKLVYAMSVLFYVLVITMADKIQMFVNYKILLVICVLFTTSFSFYNAKKINKVLICMLIFVQFIFADLLTFSIDKYISSINIVYDENYHRMLMLLTSKLILFILVKLCSKKKLSTNINIKINILYYAIIILSPVTSIFVFMFTFFLSQFCPPKYHISHLIFFISVGMLFFNLFIFYVFDILLKASDTEKNALLMEQQYKLQAQNFAYIENKQNLIKSIKHDMKNHFLCIKKFANENKINELKDYINKIDNRITQTNIYSNTKNTVFDALLNEKCEQASKNGVEISLKINVPPKLNIDNDELCIVLANILDNAIEAATACEKNKFINLCIEYKKELLLFNIENNFNVPPTKKDDDFVTSKDDHDFHGIGLKNVKSIIKKYNGYISFTVKENRFKVEILMCDAKIW